MGIIQNGQEESDERNTGSIGITGNKGGVFGTGFRGDGNVVGERIAYTKEANIINISINSPPFKEFQQILKKIFTRLNNKKDGTCCRSMIGLGYIDIPPVIDMNLLQPSTIRIGNFQS